MIRVRSRLFLTLVLTALAALPGQVRADDGPQGARLRAAPVQGRLASALARAGAAPLRVMRSGDAGGGGGGTVAEFVHLHLEFQDARSAAQFRVEGVTLVARTSAHVEALIPASALRPGPNGELSEVAKRIVGASGLRAAESDSPVAPPPRPRVLADEAVARAPSERIVQGGFRDARGLLQGEGVIIAIVDDGVDFRHPDFIEYDAQGRPTSRLLYLWDMADQLEVSAGMRQKGVMEGPLRYPGGDPVGVVYTQRALTAALRRQLGKRLPETYVGPHGSCCAGVAAGNGNAWMRWWDEAKRSRRVEMEILPGRHERMGVAPKADIIAVKIASKGGGLDYGGFLPAICAWLGEVAGKKPLVVSCSFGGHYGPHDGSSLRERHLSTLYKGSRAGRAICIAAGNEGGEGMHTDFDLGEQPTELEWTVADGATVDNFVILVCVDGELEEEDLVVELGKGPRSVKFVEAPSAGQISGNTSFSVSAPAEGGSIFLANKSGRPLKADAYILPAGSGVRFKNPTPRHMIGAPGTSTSAITVGSFDWNASIVCSNGVATMRNVESIGRLSDYSVPGPRRDGFVKPEVVAPGQWYQSPLPVGMQSTSPNCKGSFIGGGKVLQLPKDISGAYTLMNGTSAATPYTAGIVALMLQRDPTLTLDRIRELLAKHANKLPMRQDQKTTFWGNGKLDMRAISNIFKEINGR